MRKYFVIFCIGSLLLISSCILVSCGPEPTYQELKQEHEDGKSLVGGLILGVVLVGGFIWFVKSHQKNE